MYVIQDYRDGKRDPVVLARFGIEGGKAVFDETVGDPDIVLELKSGIRGIPPEEGDAFLAACKDAFCGGPFVNDEELFRLTDDLWRYCRDDQAQVPAAS